MSIGHIVMHLSEIFNLQNIKTGVCLDCLLNLIKFMKKSSYGHEQAELKKYAFPHMGYC